MEGARNAAGSGLGDGCSDAAGALPPPAAALPELPLPELPLPPAAEEAAGRAEGWTPSGAAGRTDKASTVLIATSPAMAATTEIRRGTVTAILDDPGHGRAVATAPSGAAKGAVYPAISE